MSRLSIRLRLTLWYGAVLATVLAVFSVSVYLLMDRLLESRTDQALDHQMVVMEGQISRADNERMLRDHLTWQFDQHPVYEMQVTENGDNTWLRSERIVDIGLPKSIAHGNLKEGVFEDVDLPLEGRHRMLSKEIVTPYASLLVQIAHGSTQNDKHLGELREILLFTGPALLVCALGCGYLLARKALAPVDRLAAEADKITATRLDLRLDSLNPDDELGRLTRTLNGMIARLERSFGEIQRFTADAAHELRTPLAALRNEAEVTLRQSREPQFYRHTLENMLEEIDHLTRMTENLLFLCREDAADKPSFADLRLDELARGVTEHMRIVANADQLELDLVEPLAPCIVHGDHDRLRRLLFNLIDNSVKYTPAEGRIHVGLDFRHGQARLYVEDTGIGIASEHFPNIFDRFYRVDSARPRHSSATGLGLAICQSIAVAHEGDLEIESQPGRGTRITMVVPATLAESDRRVATTASTGLNV
ncbi:MAG: ATP-binding protein [Paludisphaera borealis]|uniref:ATP-binding protein n=1 Tax=Paludisphaera borealis TaxID=1387353 RepID=UPI002843834C|nr:ATP-binding protein [Paludisphaera borealis]MDR3620708.1 ATP-binding protein [Paludisphaera borealis]